MDSVSATASARRGTAVNTMETAISSMGTKAMAFCTPLPPGTRKGRGVSGSTFRSFKKAGNTGR